VVHIVQAGDTLIEIAKRYGISVEAIQEANAILDPHLLQIGQELLIPPEENDGNPTPTPTAVPFEILNINFHESPVGSLWCLGEIWNIAGFDIERVQVEVSLYDEDGDVLAIGSSFIALDVVPEGEKAPFAILFADPPQRFAKYKAVPLSGDPVLYLGNRYLDLEIVNERGFFEENIFILTGEVMNKGDFPAREVVVVVTVYDGGGRVAGFRQVELNTEILPPGASSTFLTSLSPIGGEVITYTFVAEGKRVE
jgi:LysM repeat protein